MAKRTVEVKLPSVCLRRHSNPVLFVPLKPYVLVASGSTPSQIKPQAPPVGFVVRASLFAAILGWLAY